jgi:hypothetical protein
MSTDPLTPRISVDSELERMLFPATVPDDALAARRYAARLQSRHYRDVAKMRQATMRLNALAEGAAYVQNEPLRRTLTEIADSLL